MNRKTLITTATTFIALIGAASAFAQEATHGFATADVLSTKSRAEVRSELAAAQRAGTFGYGEASPAPVAASTVTRTQVLAETREAQRLGLLGASNEGEIRIATQAEEQAIRSAGLRAIDTSVARSAQ